ncbi:hypothetical protein [Thalassospira xiamenensis]|jgi:hypothetical protein|uniref:hypothetical protein n=1 Tax=Thalassospira xiamenensis TaxID=220697 RepID=UPI00241BEB01|nr:hypothetical protein [Thalassospira xiamenensis]|tara:strand:- start:26591 stop:27676 length:1086 start_codon:yes stop_codon:yes gene_type:complete
MTENTPIDEPPAPAEQPNVTQANPPFWDRHLGNIIAFLALGVAVYGLNIVSDIDKERSAFEAIDFFTPKANFQSGNAYYDTTNESFFVHLKLSNSGKVPVSIKPNLAAFQIFYRTLDQESGRETYTASQAGTLYRDADKSQTVQWPATILAPNIQKELGLAFPRTVDDYPQSRSSKPPYVCAYVEMTINSYIDMNSYKELLPDVDTRKFHSLGSTINLVLQSYGTPNDETYDSLFCQKNIRQLVKQKLVVLTKSNSQVEGGNTQSSVCDQIKISYDAKQKVQPLQKEIRNLQVELSGPFEQQVETLRDVIRSQDLKRKIEEIYKEIHNKSSKQPRAKRFPNSTTNLVPTALIDPSSLGCEK